MLRRSLRFSQRVSSEGDWLLAWPSFGSKSMMLVVDEKSLFANV